MSAILDDPEGMRAIDEGDMMGQILGFPEHLSSGLCSLIDIDFNGKGVCLCGMGGSAISGDILADCVARGSKSFMSVVRGMDFPGWVGEDTLLIAVSYSGNTKEVLAAFDNAIESGARMVAVTSGGTLETLCEETGTPVAKVPSGYQPRAALGFLLGTTACVLQRAGIMPMADMLDEMVDSLGDLQSRLTMEVSIENNPAKRLAMELEGSIPVIYASGDMRSAGLRWQTQVNENSKMLAFTGEVPECNHNHIVGWMEGIETQCRPLFLRAVTDNPMVSEIMSVTIDSLERGGRRPISIEFDSDSRIGNIMSAIIYGDFVSYYLAMLNGADPLPVESIGELKRRLP
jgi:glucose/mannose-6-phosphate isomerase